MYFAPDVVPDVLAKYTGLFGHNTSFSPFIIFDMYEEKSS